MFLVIIFSTIVLIQLGIIGERKEEKSILSLTEYICSYIVEGSGPRFKSHVPEDAWFCQCCKNVRAYIIKGG